MTKNNKTIPDLSSTQSLVVPDGYKEDAKGNLIPLANIREIDLMRDKEVAEMIEAAKAMQEQLRQFKQGVFDTIASFVELSAERYGVSLGGKKGNVMLRSFDGRYKVQFAIAERLTFDEGLQAAKALIDECLHDWTEGANKNLKAIVDRAFDTDKEGNLSATRILSLRRTQIDDPRWIRAMDAIAESVQVSDTATYVRFYERSGSDQRYQAISLDIASV